MECLLRRSQDVAAIKRGLRLILHRLSSPVIADEALCEWSSVLAEVVTAMRNSGNDDVQDVAFFCVDSETTKSLSNRSLGDAARKGTSAIDPHELLLTFL